MNSPVLGASVADNAARILARRSTTALLLIIFALTLPFAAQAQSYVYVNNQDLANSVVAYSVSASGTLAQIAGSPFTSGGIGSTASCYGLDRITISAPNNLLFVSNGGDQTISVFSINPATGGLTLGPGSPFATGLTLDSCGGISLAATADGKFLMASSNGQIKTFSVAANGVLTPVASTANCCSPTVGMKISPNGKFLAVSNESSISVYAINADGSLTASAGSPFGKTGTGLLSSVEFTCAADRLYGSEASFGTSSIVDAWAVDANGVLSPLIKSPFTAAGNDSSTLTLSSDNGLVFTNNQASNKISSFTVNADGSLTSIGSFGGVGTVHVPAGLVADASGSLLFAADDTFGVAVYKITASGGLTSVTDIGINRANVIQGLAAYPPKRCASADLALTMAAAPATVDAGSNVTYSITITNNGPDSTSATIVDNLPTGATFVSCTSTGTGVCTTTLPNPHTITFASLASGETETVTLVAQTSATLLNGSSFSNTASIGNKSAADPNPANNSATATVAINAPPSATTLTVAPATGSYGGLSILTATLRKSSNSAVVSGKTVSFSLNGTPFGTAVTDGVGNAILTISVAGLPIGSYANAISANFAGDALFNPSSGSSSLTINKAVLTVLGSNAVRLYGDPNPAFTYVISGFMNGETIAVVSGTTTCSSATDVTTPVGRYPVNCDLGTLSAVNYTFTLFPGTLTINPAPLTVTGDSKTRVYGDSNPTFTGTVTGLKNADVLTPTFSSPATAAAPVGTYPIVPFIAPSSVSANYAITFINGTLTVTPAALTVNVDSATRLYGDANPVFTGSIVGVKNNDLITTTFSTLATPASPIGTYPITATIAGANLTNYTVTINNGTLTITAAPLTVNVDSFTRLYGDPNPVFTGTVNGIKNGDPITVTYSSTATQASPTGVYSIIATLADPALKLGNYTVTINNGTLTINAAPLSVTAANATRLYGSPNPIFTGTLVGVKNGDNITVTYSTTADPTSSVGTYSIVPTLVDPAGKLGNYTVTIVNGVLTVNPAPLVVTPTNVSRAYGDPNPTLTGTLATVVNADPITATFTTTAVQASPVGTYPITATLSDPAGKLSNYTVTVKQGTLTINKAPLTVTGFNGSRIYGDPNPAPTVTGLKLNDPITFGYSATSPNQSSPIGTYIMIPVLVSDTQNKLPNYTLTLANGTMTINQAQFTISANSVSRAYGSPNPVFTGTFSNSNTVTPITTVLANDGISYSFLTTATQTSNAGTFAITVAASDPNKKLSNYKVVQANGNLTITQVPLTVTETAQSILLGGNTWACSSATLPSAATPSCVSYSGFVQNGVVNDGPANLGGSVSCTLSNGTGNVGTFSNGITCSGLTSPNYTFTFVKASYNVQYEPAGFTCTSGPGHVILSPIAADGSSVFTKSTTPTIAVQFRVCDVKGTSISASGVVSSFVLTAVNGVPASTPAPSGAFAFVGGTLANGAGSQGWQLNLSTSNLTAGNTYAYRINLNDGTSISLQFKLQ